MSEAPNLTKITDRAIKDIARRVAGMDIWETDRAAIDETNARSLVTTARGDYELTIVFCTGLCVMRAIAENMKHGQRADDADIVAYTKEFFNILCGHVVSALNRSVHASARFGIPLLIKGPYQKGPYETGGQRSDLCYQCCHGPVRVSILYQSNGIL